MSQSSEVLAVQIRCDVLQMVHRARAAHVGSSLSVVDILAVLYAGAVEVVAHYGDALSGKILVDITNPFNADVSGLVTTAGNSLSQQITAVAPEDAHVVKAFNTILRGVLAGDKPLDAFLAGDSAEAKTRVAAFLESLDLRPLDAGGLEMAYVLEWASILLVGLARNGAGFDLALGAEVL